DAYILRGLGESIFTTDWEAARSTPTFAYLKLCNRRCYYSGFRSNEKTISKFCPIFIGVLSFSIPIRAKTTVKATSDNGSISAVTSTTHRAERHCVQRFSYADFFSDVLTG